MGWRVRCGGLHAFLWRSRHGAIAKAALTMAPAWKLLGAGWRDKRGSVATMAGLLGTALIGFAALAVDVSVWEVDVGTMQGAADQAALAAGLAMSAGSNVAKKEAKGVAAAHGFVETPGGVSVTPTIDPNTNTIEVVITQPQTTFLSVVYLKSPPVASVRAVAAPTPTPTCILMLATTGTAITASNGAGINASSCDIYVNSGSSCDVSASGGANVTAFDIFLGEQSQAGCVTNGAQVKATDPALGQQVQFGTQPAGDPYASRTIPKPTTPCTKMPALSGGGTASLPPGTYCSLTVSNGQVVTLSSGVYILDGGGIDASGGSRITGTNVTLVLTSSGTTYGGVSVTNGATMTLTPTTATTTPTVSANDYGIALWLDPAGKKDLTVNGGASLTITGAVYAPASAVSWANGGSSPCTQLVASTMSLSGGATFSHDGCSDLGVRDVASAAGYKLSE